MHENRTLNIEQETVPMRLEIVEMKLRPASDPLETSPQESITY